MIILSIDASTTCSGYAIFENDKLIDYGAIKPQESLDWRDRIASQSLSLIDIFRKYRPDILYAEDVPAKDGKLTIEKLGAMQGVLIALCAAYKTQPYFLLPSKWRSNLNLFDGTKTGLQRDVLKKKAIEMANEEFGLNLTWVAPKSKKNQDDVAEGILIGWSQIKLKNNPKSQT